MQVKQSHKVPPSDDCMGNPAPSYWRSEGLDAHGRIVFGTGNTELASVENCLENIEARNREILKHQNTPGDLNDYSRLCHEANAKWWVNLVTGERLNRNKGELLMLMVSELSEAMEGERKDLMDDKLPHRKMAEVELVDCLIRIFDYAGGFGYDLQGAFEEKMAFNANRADHSHEQRKLAGGKKW